MCVFFILILLLYTTATYTYTQTFMWTHIRALKYKNVYKHHHHHCILYFEHVTKCIYNSLGVVYMYLNTYR